MQSLGRYQLLSKLAAGGMAEVYLARTDGPAGFRKTLVVKRILPHLADNESFVEMFLNEARLVAPLNHPNVIQIFELGQAEGTYFLAMELVDGPSVRALAKASRAAHELLPLPVVLKIISHACEGLAYAHDFADESGRPLNLVHRDVSTDNLLLSRSGSVKVADFGIAKAANLPNVTKTGMLKGKITYMAPEHLLGEPLDRRADVFALGVVMHEVLAGAKPFDSTSEVAAMRAILQEAPRRLGETRLDAPAGLQEILDRALEKDRNNRYPDMRALQSDIESLLIRLGVSVRPLDIGNLVERYFPKPPVADKTEESSIEALEKSLSTAIGIKSDEFAALTPEPAPPPKPAPKAKVPPPPPNPTRVEPVAAVPATELLAPKRAPTKSSTSRTAVSAGFGAVIALVAVIGFLKLHRPAPEIQTIAPPAPVQPVAAVVTPVPVAVKPVAAAAPPAPTPAPAPTAPTNPTPPAPVAEAPAQPARRHHERSHERSHPVVSKPVAVVAHASPEPQGGVKLAASASAEPEKPGRLVVRIQPWAEVEIDGTSYGVTPISPVSLMPGNHSVRLKNSELGVNRVVPVAIHAGASHTLKLNLEE